jgi:hypothetical protein
MHAHFPGWTAAGLMVATFACRDARLLRPLAALTNVAFIGYGWTAQLPPVLASFRAAADQPVALGAGAGLRRRPTDVRSAAAAPLS